VIATQQIGQAGLHGPYRNARIWLDFEDGLQDFGTGRSVWTAQNVGESSTLILAGNKSLRSTTSNDYLTASATSGNMLPATADWDLEFLVHSGNWTSRYVVSVQDTTATAAGTQFAWATGAGGVPVFVLSDGATRSTIITAPGAMSINTTYAISVTRRSSTIAMTRDGSAYGSGVFAGSINQPAGRAWRIFKPEFAGSGAATAAFDRLRLRVY
jgi:hypothetical protein